MNSTIPTAADRLAALLDQLDRDGVVDTARDLTGDPGYPFEQAYPYMLGLLQSFARCAVEEAGR